MQLSMQILRDRLEKYRPEPDIRKNVRHLQNVRLFSENLRFSPSTVYLMPVEQDRVICSNENDILVLHSDDVNDVFNEILDTFEYYHDQEEYILQRINAGCSSGEFVQLLSGMTGYFLILADAGFCMQATAGPKDILDSQPGLEDMIGQRMIPLSALAAINEQPYIRRHDVPPYLTHVPELGTACVTNLFPDENHAGWLIACTRDNAFTQGDKDLVDCAGRLAELWLSRNKTAEEHSQKAGMLQPLLEGDLSQLEEITEWLAAFGWMSADEKQVFALRLAGKERLPVTIISRALERQFSDAFVLQSESGLFLLVNYALVGKKNMRQMLEEFLAENELSAGESAVFRNLSELKENADAAGHAAVFAAAEPGQIWSFRKALLPYTLSLLRERAEQEPVHPAVRVLENYDKEHDAGLLHTLRVFLEENCSYTAAARALYIHRSTLIYRMERIRELTQVDLTDPGERFLLQMAFYLTEK